MMYIDVCVTLSREGRLALQATSDSYLTIIIINIIIIIMVFGAG